MVHPQLKRSIESLSFSGYKLTRRNLYNAPALKVMGRSVNNSSSNNNDQQQYNLESAKQNTQIVVIGAGLAGLSAAQHLLRHGFRSTIVLEATDRYGGRVNSKRFGDTYCELGAKWVNMNIDGAHNTIYELLRNAEGLRKQLKQRECANYVHTQGREVPPNMVELIDMQFRQLCRGFKVSEKVKSGGDLHVLDNVMAYFKTESEKLVGHSYPDPEKRALAREIFQSLFKEFSSILGCCLEYVNIEHITSCPVQQELRPLYVPTGLDNVLDTLTQHISKEQLQTGKPVGSIQWQTLSDFGAPTSPLPQERKCVACLDGTLYSADHIICTLPLGVLKNFSAILFKPALPLEKLQAIRNLGYGNPVKIYLAYKRPISRWLKSNLRPLGAQLGKDEPAITVNGRQERLWTQQVVEISQLPSSQHVLEIRVGGGYYDEIEKLPDVTLLEQITALLRQCLRNRLVPYPQALLRSNWSTSACYLGGRPYFSTTSSARDVQRLAEPLGDIAPTLLFAGDATALKGFGTIDGARTSGIREAQRIIDYYYLKQYM
ncbi:protein anon-37Cs [Scaptodrosophila lebanonensis]|uniref:Protein anon-37Cs n=2 Tax=Drosophila lebanonensis TaxID=7225 RepID=A37C_DROLE|nr:protein anon-37Cs [Scaptodrosophila lebanonensis]O96570.1 RecName: Full=Protein anon-37Cs [Scaptodrosophila lebanonensis]AAC67584.1 Cs protein [Scaptodrosophila lebanonensis]